jgi:hypothetical protein
MCFSIGRVASLPISAYGDAFEGEVQYSTPVISRVATVSDRGALSS